MPEFIKREFKQHPLGTFLVCLTCFSMMAGGIAFVYAQGAKAAEIDAHIGSHHVTVEELAKTFTPRDERLASVTEREKRFEAKAAAIESDIEDIKEMQKEQRALSVEILKRLPPNQ